MAHCWVSGLQARKTKIATTILHEWKTLNKRLDINIWIKTDKTEKEKAGRRSRVGAQIPDKRTRRAVPSCWAFWPTRDISWLGWISDSSNAETEGKRTTRRWLIRESYLFVFRWATSSQLEPIYRFRGLRAIVRTEKKQLEAYLKKVVPKLLSSRTSRASTVCRHCSVVPLHMSLTSPFTTTAPSARDWSRAAPPDGQAIR